ncbi:MAG: hypothetical protein JWM59_4155 [Verrucomicrobiales bacterium]|nr:hypothetical protein [Verrucomicrobiales bacterium]
MLKKIEFYSLREDPDLWEKLILEENSAAAAGDADAKYRVESMFWEADRELAFRRYVESLDFRQILDLLHVFRISRKNPLCEIGGGSGQLAWSLATSGFQQVELLEPNPRWITGTGWLETRLEDLGGRLTIRNDLTQWYADEKLYHNVITRNCVHHFPNIPMAAAAIRQKLKKGGHWVMIREWFADTPQEMRRQMTNHPYCQKYGVYEFPFPSRHYVDSLEYAGFKLRAAVPLGWGNNALSSYSPEEGSRRNQKSSRLWRSILKRWPRLTSGLFRLENFSNRTAGTGFRKFSRPQMLVFQRVED